MGEILDILAQNGAYSGGPLGAGDRAELFGRHAGKGYARPFEPPHQLAGDRRGQEPLAVQERVHAVAMIHGGDEVAHAFDEEAAARIAIAAIALEPRDVRQGRRD
jgi:hypothetical protein